MESKRRNWPLRLTVMVVLAMGAMWMLGGRRPDNLGVQGGKLAACPESPNCVSTQAGDADHRIEPVSFQGSVAEAKKQVRTAVAAMPRTKIISESEDYLHAECRSLVCRFVDDLEVWIDAERKLIHVRSASRVGYSDFGVNRKRAEGLLKAIGASPVEE